MADSSYEDEQSSKSGRAPFDRPDNWANKASATRSAFFSALTYAAGDIKSYDIDCFRSKKGITIWLAIMDQHTSPQVCESLVEVELL